jgi:hypothetical protein
MDKYIVINDENQQPTGEFEEIFMHRSFFRLCLEDPAFEQLTILSKELIASRASKTRVSFLPFIHCESFFSEGTIARWKY